MAARQPDVEGIFPGDVKRLLTLRGEVLSSLPDAENKVKEAATLMTALGKVNEALALRAQWKLFRVRLEYAALAEREQGSDFTKLDIAFDTALSELWLSLAGHSQQLKHLQASSTFKEAFSAPFALTADGMPTFTYVQFAAECDLAQKLTEDLMMKITGKLSVMLQTEGEKLERAIPDYAPYVVTEWDTDKAVQELVTKSWEWFAKTWAQLTKELWPKSCRF